MRCVPSWLHAIQCVSNDLPASGSRICTKPTSFQRNLCQAFQVVFCHPLLRVVGFELLDQVTSYIQVKNTESDCLRACGEMYTVLCGNLLILCKEGRKNAQQSDL